MSCYKAVLLVNNFIDILSVFNKYLEMGCTISFLFSSEEILLKFLQDYKVLTK